MASPGNIFRFGPYELRVRTRELYKNGTKLRLRPQPFRVLQALVEQGGDIVTRDELRQLLWPAETFVDFEHGLNNSIKELRAVLNDSVGEPRYIETLPKLGYRVVAPVECESPRRRAEDKVQQREDAAIEIEAPPAPASASESGPFDVVHGMQAQGIGYVAGEEHRSPAPAGRDSGRTPPRQERASRPEAQPLQQEKDTRPALRRWAIPAAIALVLIVALTAYVQWSRSRDRFAAPGGRAMLAVLPFENLTGDANEEYFSDGLTEEMITQLGELNPERLGVIARTSVMRFKRTQASLPQIGQELGVQYVLEGSVRRDGDKVRVSAQLIQVKDQTHLWARQYDRELNNLLTLQGEISQEVADEIQITLGDARERASTDRKPTAAPGSYEAYDLYLRGRYFWNKRTPEGFQQAAEYFQQAIARDPNYAAAYAGLADTFGLMSTWGQVPQNEFMPKARATAQKALALDPSLAEAHTSLALVAENYDYNWQAAEKEFRRAIQLNPQYATAHQWYAECLSWQGRFNEALAESERARQLDPLSLIIATDHGAILYFSRQYDPAIEQFRSVLARDPSFGRASGLMVYAYVQEGRFAEALDEIERRYNPDISGWKWMMRAYVWGRWGRNEQAQQALEKLEQIAHRYGTQSDGTQLSVWTQALVTAYSGMDRKDEALALLQKAYREHSNLLVLLKVDPIFDPLRGDPRFRDLVRRVGLPP